MMHECPCCSVFFATKRLFNTHVKKCTQMDIEVQQKKKLKQIPSAVRFNLWNTTFGERCAFGPCHCCRREVTLQNFEAGHVVAKSQGGSDQISNLRVICRPCNRSMGSMNMDAYIEAYHNHTIDQKHNP